jgi:hypothetical protein
MYEFIYNMWIMKRIDSNKVDQYVTKGYITQEQADAILATPQLV